MWFFSDYTVLFRCCFFFKKMFPLKLAKFITLQQEGIFSSPCFVCAVVCVLCCGTSCVHSTRSAAVALSHTEKIHSGQDKDLGTDSLTWHLYPTLYTSLSPSASHSFCCAITGSYSAIVPLDGGSMHVVCSSVLALFWVFKTAGGWSAVLG